MQRIRRRLRDQPTRANILEVIAGHPDGITVSGIAELLQANRTTVSRHLHFLHEHGVVERLGHRGAYSLPAGDKEPGKERAAYEDLSLLGYLTRFEIFKTLANADRPLAVMELKDENSYLNTLADLSEPLSGLATADIVHYEARGQYHYYSLTDKGRELWDKIPHLPSRDMLVEHLQLLGGRSRYLIARMLLDAPPSGMHLSDIVDRVNEQVWPQLHKSSIERDTTLLRKAGLIEGRKEGKYVIYAVAEPLKAWAKIIGSDYRKKETPRPGKQKVLYIGPEASPETLIPGHDGLQIIVQPPESPVRNGDNSIVFDARRQDTPSAIEQAKRLAARNRLVVIAPPESAGLFSEAGLTVVDADHMGELSRHLHKDITPLRK